MADVNKASPILGTISLAISIIDATYEVYGDVEDKAGLPKVFNNVAFKLPFISYLFGDVKRYIKKTSKNSIFPLPTTLEDCKVQATKVQQLFEKVIPEIGDSRWDRKLLKTTTCWPGPERSAGSTEDERLWSDAVVGPAVNKIIWSSNIIQYYPASARNSNLDSTAISAEGLTRKESAREQMIKHALQPQYGYPLCPKERRDGKALAIVSLVAVPSIVVHAAVLAVVPTLSRSKPLL